MDKEKLKEREAKAIELAVAFCNEHLDEECAALCTKMIQKLGRKRSNPLQSGRVEIWAAASGYTICSINFMFGKIPDCPLRRLKSHNTLVQAVRR